MFKNWKVPAPLPLLTLFARRFSYKSDEEQCLQKTTLCVKGLINALPKTGGTLQVTFVEKENILNDFLTQLGTEEEVETPAEGA
jgi:hypothetical protein